jgi:arginyl-tRNA synthetase
VTPEQLRDVVRSAVASAVQRGALAVAVPDDVVVERPRNPEHGDYATNVALRLAKAAGRPPREVAELLAGELRGHQGIATVDVAGPGFLNVTFVSGVLGAIAVEAVTAGKGYGRTDALAGQKLNLEFVSANPTGPVHIGAVRWAAVGDALGRLLEAGGADVTREYYFNDAGSQIDRFARSLQAAAQGRPVPEDGYAGAYIEDIAAEVVAAEPGLLERPDDEQLAVFRSRGVELMWVEIRSSLAEFGVVFDVYFSERTLHDSGAITAAVDRLREQGHVYEAEGAVWLRTTEFGDDRDRVLVRSDGSTTYFAADAAYYLSKKDRGFDEKVYMLGADHHGFVNRLKAIAACAGDDPERNIEVLIGQLVTVSGARLSKRAGNIIELRDVVAWLGRDAVRYSLARYPADSPITLDPELLTKRSNDNPVFYVQYAHARTCNVTKLAVEDGVRTQDGFDPSLLTDATESVLLATLGEFPGVVAGAAELREPHRVARYLESLAAAYHKWYDTCRVRPLDADEPVSDLHRTRLWVNEATRAVLARGLDLLGVSAPERM